MEIKNLKIIVPAVALAIAGVHAFAPDKPKIDPITIALLVIGLFPWIGSLIETLKYGDLEIKLRKAEANAEEAKGAAESARQLALGQTEVRSESALSGLTQTHLTRESAISEMQKLAVEYAEKRMKNRPGDFRTALMTKIIHQMMALAPEVPREVILPWLNDPDGAKRLAVYAYLYARPDFNEVDALLESVANRENPPFAQYWGIMALRKVIGARGEASLKPATVSGLRAFLKTLGRGTDRYYELSRLLQDLGWNNDSSRSGDRDSRK